MFRLRIFHLFILLCSFSPIGLSGQSSEGIHLFSINETIRIKSIDEGFTSETKIRGMANSLSAFPVTYYDTAVDSLTDFTISYFGRKNRIRQGIPEFVDMPLMMQYHSSRVCRIMVPDTLKEFICSYKKTSKSIYSLSSLALYSLIRVDTITYRLFIPDELHLVFDTVFADSINFLDINVSKQANTSCYTIKVRPFEFLNQKPSMNYSDLDDINHCLPILRFFFSATTDTCTPDVQFSKRYMQLTDSLTKLTPSNNARIDSIISKLPSGTDMINYLYDYVRFHFKYLPVQTGTGAYIPHNVNTIMKNNQGDCKDLSLLLTILLNKAGFKATLALASTYSHPYDFDFPSLVSGNHMICVVYSDTGYIVLDPTDKVHKPGKPIISLQGRTIFILDTTTPAYFKMPCFNADENEISITTHLVSDGKSLAGPFQLQLSGYFSDYYKSEKRINTTSAFNETIKDLVKTHFSSAIIDSISTTFSPDHILIAGKVRYNNKIYNNENKTFLFVDFSPYIMKETIHKNTVQNSIFTGLVYRKNFTAFIHFNKPLRAFVFSHEKMNNSVCGFSIEGFQQDQSTVKFVEVFQIDAISIKDDQTKSFNSIIDSFNKKIHETAIIEF